MTTFFFFRDFPLHNFISHKLTASLYNNSRKIQGKFQLYGVHHHISPYVQSNALYLQMKALFPGFDIAKALDSLHVYFYVFWFE